LKSLLFFLLFLLFFTSFSLPPAVCSQSRPDIKETVNSSITSTVSTVGEINWSQFWQTFNTYAFWDLEWYNKTSSQWVNVNEDLTIVRNYPEPNWCKITLIFNASHSGSYRLTFAINKTVKKYLQKIDKHQYELTYDDVKITFDWSDCAGISGLKFSHGVKKGYFWFRIRKDNILKGTYIEIDPSTIGTSTAATATSYPFQRKGFYANGRFWVFCSDGTNMVYRTSTDGSTWTSATTVRIAAYGYTFSVWFDGTYVHYAYADSSSIYYRRGTPNTDGTITWSATEQTVSTTYNSASNPMISVDSSGYVWIGYRDYDSTNVKHYPYVIKSGNNNGTWGTTPSGFPYQLSASSYTGWKVSVTPLTGGKMFTIYSYCDPSYLAPFYARSWNGSAWLNEISTTSNGRYAMYHSAVAQGDDVHFVFLKSTGYDILYVKYDYSSNNFGSETTLQAGATSSSTPVISIDTATNDTYVFWAGYPTTYQIYYRKWNGTAWESVVDWIFESLTDNDRLTSFYQEAYRHHMGLVYMTGFSSPYNVRFALTNDPPTNLACDSTETFVGDYYGWLNLTISDPNGYGDFNEVQINVTLVDGKSFIFNWTQSTDTFAEVSDPDGIATLNATASVRTNVNATTDIISFYFKVGSNTTTGYADVIATTTDDYGLSDEDTYNDEFRVYIYTSTYLEDFVAAVNAVFAFMSDISTIIAVLSFIFSLAMQVINTVVDYVFRFFQAIPT